MLPVHRNTLTSVCSLPENYFNPACKCVNPPTFIKNVSGIVLEPYYCWYAPCLAPTAIKTPEIIQGQLSCRITNCSITIDQIKIEGGVVNILNECATKLLDVSNIRNLNVSLKPVEFDTRLPVLSFGVIALMLTAALLN